MLDTCQLKIDVGLSYIDIYIYICLSHFFLQQEMKENDADYISTEILTILSNRINDMYNNMFQQFPVEKTSLSEYIEFCSNNVSAIFIIHILHYQRFFTPS